MPESTAEKIRTFAWTRRLIALGAVGAIIVLPKVAAVWYPEIGVVVGYTEVQGGFLNFLFGPNEAIVWKAARGFVITPLDTHIVLSHCRVYTLAQVLLNKVYKK